MSKTVVITGATRGIGLGLATAFLELGHSVALCGRSDATTRRVAEGLADRFGADRVLGRAADVSDRDQVQALWDAAIKRFRTVDLWINNAGLAGGRMPSWERPPEDVEQVVKTNVIGVVNGSSVAVAGMLAQGGGAIFNMEGLGSKGPVVGGTSVYGASKAAVTRFTQALVKEVAGTPVRVGFLSPGMVVTNLLVGSDPGRVDGGARRIYNILADRVETVAPFLARRALQSTRNGARVEWLSGAKVVWRFATAPFRKNRLFPAR